MVKISNTIATKAERLYRAVTGPVQRALPSAVANATLGLDFDLVGKPDSITILSNHLLFGSQTLGVCCDKLYQRSQLCAQFNNL